MTLNISRAALRNTLFIFGLSIFLISCGGGANVTGTEPPAGSIGSGSGSGSVVTANNVIISWQENPASEQVSHYIITAENISTKSLSSITLSISGAAPDISATSGVYTYTAKPTDLGIATHDTFAITISARNETGISLPSDPEYVSF